MKLFQKDVLIPQIEKKIEKKLRLLNLYPAVSPNSFIRKKGIKKHRYFSLCKDLDGNETLFYARLHNNQNAQKKFITEINFLKKIKKSNLKIKNKIPEIKNWGRETDFEWLQRDKIKPNPLANLNEKNLSKTFKKISNELSSFIFQISRIKTRGLVLEKFDWNDYCNHPPLNKLFAQGIISKKLSEELKQKLKKEAPLLKRQNIYLSHGDLTLENILFGGNKLWIIDWEKAHLNHFAYDVAFLWTHLWKSKFSRKKLIESYLKDLNDNKKIIFKKIFPVVASYLALGGVFLDIDKEREKDRNKRKNFCIQILKKSPQGFASLIKV